MVQTAVKNITLITASVSDVGIFLKRPETSNSLRTMALGHSLRLWGCSCTHCHLMRSLLPAVCDRQPLAACVPDNGTSFLAAR